MNGTEFVNAIIPASREISFEKEPEVVYAEYVEEAETTSIAKVPDPVSDVPVLRTLYIKRPLLVAFGKSYGSDASDFSEYFHLNRVYCATWKYDPVEGCLCNSEPLEVFNISRSHINVPEFMLIDPDNPRNRVVMPASGDVSKTTLLQWGSNTLIYPEGFFKIPVTEKPQKAIEAHNKLASAPGRKLLGSGEFK